MEERWLNDLKKRSNDYERDVPAGLWDDVLQTLKERGVVNDKPTRNMALLWRRWGVAAAAILVLAVIGFIALNNTVVQDDVANDSVVAEVVDNSDVEDDAFSLPETRKKQAEQLATNSIGVGHVATNGMDAVIIDEDDKIEPTDNDVDTVATAKSDDMVAVGRIGSEGDGNGQKRSLLDGYAMPNQYNDLYRRMEIKSRQDNANRGKWSAGLYASNMSGDNNSSIGYGDLSLTSNPFSVMPKQESWTTNALANILFNNLDEPTETEISHQLPVKIGASVRYAITNRWGVESGLTYTLLKSNLTSGGESDYYATNQTLHYLGIPVKLNFAVWQNSRFRVYVSAGGVMDIPLSGKAETNYINNGYVVAYEKEDINIDRLQWSVTGAVGVQYNIIGNIGVYVEPGFAYYFDDGSDVLTIYKDKPFNFDLQVGLRFSFE